MITINSAVYGRMNVEDNQLYHFPQGIVGFSAISRYALVPFENTDFFVLHATEEDVSFILVPAAKAKREYAFEIDEDTVHMLDIEHPEEVAAFFIVNIVGDIPYINPKAPVLIVPRSQKGCQYVLTQSAYPIREPLRMEGASSC
ncbi:flagellar assembly factor FliW [Paenibacillus cisolokensis]|uniref:Flagellar assembly factor FliW n=1 Tax=Paenibacillus cisolokensis TaxID=1658519 RepID=A0ABQ4N3T8_9BACL|nr:flagellar assembly protein FliW [Paenibacillus cisolokensis]GIQ62837.1 flagellar assembly factor FliW [Paenibacillus cisolokensis]